ncbi:MAG: hypothetical protein WAN12_15275, partial [Candidatus Acidiferrum sp.]
PETWRCFELLTETAPVAVLHRYYEEDIHRHCCATSGRCLALSQPSRGDCDSLGNCTMRDYVERGERYGGSGAFSG